MRLLPRTQGTALLLICHCMMRFRARRAVPLSRVFNPLKKAPVDDGQGRVLPWAAYILYGLDAIVYAMRNQREQRLAHVRGEYYFY